MAGNIRLKDGENGDDIPAFEETSGCQLCLKNASKYTCPRCNVKYCSLDCYRGRKHVKCSESFYKDCVMDALHGETVDDEGKRRMVEVLKRFKEEETDDGLADDELELGDNLEERLHGLNLDRDTEKVWQSLTDAERKEFQRAVDDGYIGALVDTWVPWWVSRDSSTDETDKSGTSGHLIVPQLLKTIPHLSTLIKSKVPSSQTKYSLVNIIYCYIYICRLYNGCHCDFVQEAVDRLWKMSAVLFHSVNFSSLDAALCSAVEASQQDKELFCSEEFSLSVIEDVLLLLKGSETGSGTGLVELALSDTHRLFARALKLSKETPQENTKSNDGSKSLWLAKKKILFMLSWFRENKEECSSLVPFLPVIKEAMKSDMRQLQEEKSKVQQSRIKSSRKKLIEEIH